MRAVMAPVFRVGVSGGIWWNHAVSEQLAPLRALLIPTEQAPTVDEIKRALLSFEEVHLLSPEDRELIPPVAFMSAAGGAAGLPIPIGVSIGSVLPLPKIESFDDDFARTMEAVDRAGAAHCVLVKPTPKFADGFFLGGFPMPDGWPDPTWTLQTFRQLASSQDYLRAAAKSFSNWQQRIPELEKLRPEGQGLISSNTLPDLGTLGWGNDPAAELMDRLAAARLSGIVKAFGMCAVQGAHIFTTDPGAEAVLRHVADAVASVAGEDEDRDDSLGLYVSLTQRVILKEGMKTDVLRDMTVRDVVRLRTKAWGKAQEERSRFLSQVTKIAAESKSARDFERRIEVEATAYLRARSDLRHDWTKLGLETGLQLFGMGAATATATTLAEGVLPIRPDTALAVAGVIALTAKQHIRALLDAIKAERDARNTVGSALLRPYRFLF